MPTFHFYRKGKKINQMVGADEAGLRRLIAECGAKPNFKKAPVKEAAKE